MQPGVPIANLATACVRLQGAPALLMQARTLPDSAPPQVSTDDGELLALKLHRLGRTSFRQIKNRRDYLQGAPPPLPHQPIAS